jgi:hypothetical protein
VVALPCEVIWELSYSLVVCVAPLCLGGIKGKKITPSVHWEVPVRSQRLASRSWTEREPGTTTLVFAPSVKVRVLNFSLKLVLKRCEFIC